MLKRLLASCSQLRACEGERERLAHKALGLLLLAQSTYERKRYWLTRRLVSCSQLRARARERDIDSQGSWSLAHSSERVSEREREIGSQDSRHLALSSERVQEKEICSQGP